MNWKNIFVLFSLILIVQPSIAQECYQSSIVSPSPFMGNNGEILKLEDGAIWEVKYSYEYLYEYSPSVIICPTKGKLLVNGRTITVASIAHAGASKGKTPISKEVIESKIDGDFSGWDGETIFKLTNGQIWQQSSYAYTYSYRFMPKVLIIPINGGFELQVEGVQTRIKVIRLK